MSTAPDNTLSLLGYMKLSGKDDLEVYNKIAAWVATQEVTKQIPLKHASSCRTASSLLLFRLSQSFERRHAPTKQDDEKDTKSTTTTPNTTSDDPSKTAATTTTTTTTAPSSTTENGNKNVTTTSSSATGETTDGSSKPKEETTTTTNPTTTAKTETKKVAPNLEELMRRRVKVTKLVQKAVEFIGSDLLKVLQVMMDAPTVADVVHNCMSLLKTQDQIKDVYKIFQTSNGKKPEEIDDASCIYFGVFALQSLQALMSQSINAYELAYDFDFIYDSCYQNDGFKACANALNPTLQPPPATAGNAGPQYFAPDTEARNICWKLARLLALKHDSSSLKADPDGKQRRRSHILTSAASILFAASLGQAKLAAKKAEADTTEPAQKKQKVEEYALTADYIELMGTPMTDLKALIDSNPYRLADFAPITRIEIRSSLSKLFSLLSKNSLVQTAPGEGNVESESSQVSKAFSSPKLRFILQNYRSIIHNMVVETQRNLNITVSPENGAIDSTPAAPPSAAAAGVRTAIANVLMLFPMVIGEPWGIHRDAPVITSSLLCQGVNTKPPEDFKDSIAVVLTLKAKLKTRPLSTDNATAKKPAATSTTAAGAKPPPATAGNETPDVEMIDTSPPLARAPTRINMGELEPPVINDSMELNEWTLSILSLSVIKPSDSLLMYLGDCDRKQGNILSCLHDVIVPVLNRGLLRLQGMIRATGGPSPLASKNTRLTVGRKDGQVYVNGQVDEGIQLCASVVGFYYHSLEAIIHDQMERMEFLGPFGALLHSESFHRGLLTCCYACVQKGVGKTQKLEMNGVFKETTVSFLLETIESSPYTFLKVTEALRRALVVTADPSKKKIGSPIVPGLPAILQRHLQKIEVQLVDSVVWGTPSSSKSEGSLALTIKTMKALPGAWPPDVLEPSLPEELFDLEGNNIQTMMTDVKYKPPFNSTSEANFLSYVLRKLLKIGFFRVQAIFAALKMLEETLVHTQFLIAFRYVLRHHFEIFFDRHIDQILLCTIYGVCKAMKVQPEVTFGKVMDAYIAVRKNETGERACRVILRHVKLVSSESDLRPGGKVVGNLIVFYNQLFLPKMQKHLSGSKSLQRSSFEYQKKLQEDGSRPKHSMSNGESNDKTEENKKSSPSTNVQKPIGAAVSTNPVSEQAPTASKGSDDKPGASASLAKEFEPPISAKPASAENADKSKIDASMVTENKPSNGGDEKEDPIVFTAKTDSGKEVKVTQKESITGTEATANGSQKRTFSTI